MQYKVVAVVSTLAFTVTAVAQSSGSFHNSDSNFVSKSFEQSSSIFCEDARQKRENARFEKSNSKNLMRFLLLHRSSLNLSDLRAKIFQF